MNSIKNKIKAQGLPLNTIVIAILVIIVLLVIIVFFVSSVGDANEDLGTNSPNKCTLDNPVINTLQYKEVRAVACADEECNTDFISDCSDEGWNFIASVPKFEQGEGSWYKCCGSKEGFN